MKNTLIVNLYGGPGSGKSTGSAYIFSKLKMAGVDAEYVTEFAKDKVWEGNKEVFNCQFYITGTSTQTRQFHIRSFFPFGSSIPPLNTHKHCFPFMTPTILVHDALM